MVPTYAVCMEDRPEIDEAVGLKALNDHAKKMAVFGRSKHGPEIGFEQILAILADSEIMRFPVDLRFNQQLGPGEFAHAQQKGEHPSDGYWINVHASFKQQPDMLPYVIAYHMVCVNYGEMATAECAEIFGSALLGLDTDVYYEDLCVISDGLGGIPVEAALESSGSGGCGTGCSSGGGSSCGQGSPMKPCGS